MIEGSERSSALATPELMEGADLDPAVLRSALRHVELVTRWGGAFGRMVRAVRSCGGSPGRRERAPGDTAVNLRLLDVGAGSGGIGRAVAAAATTADRRWVSIGLDNHEGVAALSAANGAAGPGPVRGDARTLPFADDSFDAALCNLTLHHFDGAEGIGILEEMARVAHGNVIVADLERRRVAYLGARALSWTVWRRNPLVRHDAPLSVLRGFTPAELREMGRTAGLGRLEVERVPVFRLLLTASGRATDPSDRGRTADSS